MSISVELSSEIAEAIIGREEFYDPVRRLQLIQALFEAHSTLRDLKAKCRQSHLPDAIVEEPRADSHLNKSV